MSLPTFVVSRRWWSALIAVGLGAACSSGTGVASLLDASAGGTPPIHSFEASSGWLLYRGRAEPADSGGAQITLTLRNPTRDSVRVEYGACSFALWAYASDGRAGRPVWDNRIPANAACEAIGYGFRVGPGATHDMPVGRYSAAAILGDSLPAGRYYFAVVLKNRRNRLTIVPAGDAVLARQAASARVGSRVFRGV